jgi:hypothetical protein
MSHACDICRRFARSYGRSIGATTTARSGVAAIGVAVPESVSAVIVSEALPIRPMIHVSTRLQLGNSAVHAARTRPQAEPLAVEPDLQATTVPLGLGNPPHLLLGQRARASEHRLDEARQSLAGRSRHRVAGSTQQGARLDASRRTARR